MKVFQVDDGHWYAANSAEEAQALYIHDVGEEAREYVEEFGAAEEVGGDELNQRTVVEIDEPGQPTHTFAELLATCKEPGFFCTTEY
jgi:hypothetical protein